MRLHYTLIADWPPLAWLARWHPRDDVLEVRHGRRVETHPDWFGEVVWAGAYTAGDFDRTDLVFGSGARVRDGLVTVVRAGSTVVRGEGCRAAWLEGVYVPGPDPRDPGSGDEGPGPCRFAFFPPPLPAGGDR